MSKRNLATVLWFLMGWTAGSVVAVMAGYPSSIGLLLGVLFAALVRWGPTARLWSEAPKRTVHVAKQSQPSRGTIEPA
jgi:hypothetical protein